MTAWRDLAPPDAPPHALLGAVRIDKSTRLLIWTVSLVLFALPVLLQQRMDKATRPVDFAYFYTASKIIRESAPANIYKPEIQIAATQKIHPVPDAKSSYGYFPYPPFVALLFTPASRLPFWTALRIQQVASFALYLSGLIILLRRFFPGEPVWSNLFLPFALSYLPWISNTLLNGQLSALGFWAIALALSELKAGHHFRSGLALSICLYKPTLLLLLIPMLLFARQIRVLSGFLAGGCALAAASTVALGWQIWVAYARLVMSLGEIEKLRQLPQYVDLIAFFTMLTGSRTAAVLALAATTLAIPLLIAAWRRYELNPALVWACSLTLTLILSPYVPIYDTILIIPSLIATAPTLRASAHNALAGVMLPISLSSWLSAASASLVHLQLLTLAILLLGSFQLANIVGKARTAGTPQPRKLSAHETRCPAGCE